MLYMPFTECRSSTEPPYVARTFAQPGTLGYHVVHSGHQVLWKSCYRKSCTCMQAGCTAAIEVQDAIKASDVIVTVLSDAEAIHSTVLSEESLPLLSGKCILQMGTIGPDESRTVASAVQAAGGQYIEAPVLGSQPEAAAGTLLVMVGCSEDPEGTPAWPVLKAFGEAPLHIGEVLRRLP